MGLHTFIRRHSNNNTKICDILSGFATAHTTGGLIIFNFSHLQEPVSILRLLLTVPKISPISNMTNWLKIAIFEITGKNSVLERWGVMPHLKYGKKIKKFAREVCFNPKPETRCFFLHTSHVSTCPYFMS